MEDRARIQIYPLAKIVGLEHISFGQHIIIDDFVFIYAKKPIHIGNYVHIASFVSITGGEELIMEDFSAIASGAKILTATDDFKDWGFGNPTVPEKFRNVHRGAINIGRFVIVGANSVILPGITIGEGAMIGACGIISKDIEPWAIYGGVNKIIGRRNREAVLENYKQFILRQIESGIKCFKCFNCEQDYPEFLLEEYQDKVYCISCHQRLFQKCDNCHEHCRKIDIKNVVFYDDSKNLCQSCYKEAQLLF